MRLFQVLPSVLREIDGQLKVEADFHQSLKTTLDKVEHITVACPVTAEVGDAGLRRCVPANLDRVKFIPLPNAYHPREFVRHYHSTRRLLRSEIEASDYLVFSPHALIGDWPTVAVHEAIRLNKPYAIEADVVYESLFNLERLSGWKRLIKKDILLPLFKRSYRYCLAHSKLGLFQGQDVFDAYAPYCSNPQKVYHHVPIYKGGHISEQELQNKIARIQSGGPLRICYAGRAIDMKGPMDWIAALNELLARGIPIEATWIGDGTLLPEMKAKAERFNFPGFIADQQEVLRIMKQSDIFLFCHKAQESARCLGEALACGCPLIGYASAYAMELTSEGGGALVSNWSDLADLVAHLHHHRNDLTDMVEQAALTGKFFDREERLLDRMASINSTAH